MTTFTLGMSLCAARLAALAAGHSTAALARFKFGQGRRTSCSSQRRAGTALGGIGAHGRPSVAEPVAFGIDRHPLPSIGTYAF